MFVNTLLIAFRKDSGCEDSYLLKGRLDDNDNFKI